MVCRDRHARGGHVKVDAEMGTMQLQAKGCHGWLVATRSCKRQEGSSSRALRSVAPPTP